MVEENERPVWTATFAPVTTNALRIVITQTPHNLSRLWEVEFYPPFAETLPLPEQASAEK